MVKLYKASVSIDGYDPEHVTGQRPIVASNARVALGRALLPGGYTKATGVKAPPLAVGQKLVVVIERLR